MEGVARFDDKACDGVEESCLKYGTPGVMAKCPNELDIFDKRGNLWEWCNDWYEEDCYEDNCINLSLESFLCC